MKAERLMKAQSDPEPGFSVPLSGCDALAIYHSLHSNQKLPGEERDLSAPLPQENTRIEVGI